MNPTPQPDPVTKLFNYHDYARAHGARAQQNMAFACLLARALADRKRFSIDICARNAEAFNLQDAKDALVAITDHDTKMTRRAPLCRPIDLGKDTPVQWSRQILVSVAVVARDIVELEKRGGAPSTKRSLSAQEVQELERNICTIAGGKVPRVYESVPRIE